jgi:hypothetical protein
MGFRGLAVRQAAAILRLRCRLAEKRAAAMAVEADVTAPGAPGGAEQRATAPMAIAADLPGVAKKAAKEAAEAVAVEAEQM